jgi:hypothetical protein
MATKRKEYSVADYERMGAYGESPSMSMSQAREELDAEEKEKKNWLTPKRAARKEATEMLKADKADRAEAKRPPADNVAEEKEMRRARESVRPKSGGGGGGSDTREMQLGADLDPKAMMKKEGYKKGGAVKSASARADGIAIRGKTRA